MKYLIVILSLLFSIKAGAQATLTVSISSDTIGMEDAVKVTYKLSGAQARIEILPWEGLQQVAGPNVSSSYSFVNGVSSQEYSESYILVPTEEGSIYIPSASVVIDDKAIETEPLELFVMPIPSYESKGQSKSNSKKAPSQKHKKKSDPKADEAEYQRLLKKRELAKKKKKF